MVLLFCSFRICRPQVALLVGMPILAAMGEKSLTSSCRWLWGNVDGSGGGSSASDRIWMALGEYGWLREGMDSPGGDAGGSVGMELARLS